MLRRGLIIAACVALQAASVGFAAGDDEPSRHARAIFARAEERYAAGALVEALRGFSAAYRAYPHPAFLFNVAQCLRRLGQLEGAVEHYRRYLAEWAGGNPGRAAPYAEEVEGHIRALTTLIAQRDAAAAAKTPRGDPPPARRAQLRVRRLPPGARLIVDGRALWAAEGVIHRVTPGEHEVVVRHEGRRIWRRAVRVHPGETVVLEVPARRPRPGRSRLWLVGGVASAALAAGGLALGIVENVGANDSFVDSSEFGTHRAVSITSFVLAGALAATSAVCWYYWAQSGRRPAVTAALTSGGVALVAQGAF